MVIGYCPTGLLVSTELPESVPVKMLSGSSVETAVAGAENRVCLTIQTNLIIGRPSNLSAVDSESAIVQDYVIICQLAVGIAQGRGNAVGSNRGGRGSSGRITGRDVIAVLNSDDGPRQGWIGRSVGSRLVGRRDGQSC